MTDLDVVITSRVGLVSRAMHEALAGVAARAGTEIARGASEGAPRDSGALAEGYYAITASGSGYGDAAARVAEHNPKASVAPEAEPPASELESVAAAAAGHARYVELGARSAPQPHLVPAVEVVRAGLEAEIVAALREGVEA